MVLNLAGVLLFFLAFKNYKSIIKSNNNKKDISFNTNSASWWFHLEKKRKEEKSP